MLVYISLNDALIFGKIRHLHLFKLFITETTLVRAEGKEVRYDHKWAHERIGECGSSGKRRSQKRLKRREEGHRMSRAPIPGKRVSRRKKTRWKDFQEGGWAEERRPGGKTSRKEGEQKKEDPVERLPGRRVSRRKKTRWKDFQEGGWAEERRPGGKTSRKEAEQKKEDPVERLPGRRVSRRKKTRWKDFQEGGWAEERRPGGKTFAIMKCEAKGWWQGGQSGIEKPKLFWRSKMLEKTWEEKLLGLGGVAVPFTAFLDL